MKKIESLLKKVELFEKLAVYGNGRRTFLETLAQEMSEADPNDPSKEKMYSGEYNPTNNPTPTTVVPDMTFYAPKSQVAKPEQSKTRTVENVIAVMSKYMNDPNYSKSPELQSAVDKAFNQFKAYPYNISDTGLGYQIKQLQEQMVGEPYADDAQKDFDKKKLTLLRLREQDMKKR